MASKKKTSYALADDGNGGLAPIATGGGFGGFSGLSGLPAGADRTQAASYAFQRLMARTDGWLRAIPAGENKQSYFKWKFNTGPHQGKYVMFVVPAGDWTGGILGLWEKVDEVDRGERRPAHDTFYDPR